jgi:regulator of ribonuclease activity A
MTFFTADICDDHSDKTFVVEENYTNYGGANKCQGEIVTIKLNKNNSGLISLLRDEDGTGKVVVVDVDREYYAVVGENLMKFAHKNHYAGIVINGYVRDTVQIADIPVALYALGTCSRKSIPVTECVRGMTLSFSGVEFKQGDYLYADADGIIVTASKIV